MKIKKVIVDEMAKNCYECDLHHKAMRELGGDDDDYCIPLGEGTQRGATQCLPDCPLQLDMTCGNCKHCKMDDEPKLCTWNHKNYRTTTTSRTCETWEEKI